MALADETASLTLREEGRARRVFPLGPSAKVGGRTTIGVMFEQRLDLGEVLDRQVENLAARSKARAGFGPRRRRVKRGHDGGQRIDVRSRQRLPGEDAGEQRVLGELTHLDGILDCRAISADARGVDRARDGDDLEIDRRSETSVQLQLSLAIEMAGGQRREIEEPEVDSLLDFVCMAACQQDVQNMGFDDANRRASRGRTGPDSSALERGATGRLCR